MRVYALIIAGCCEYASGWTTKEFDDFLILRAPLRPVLPRPEGRIARQSLHVAEVLCLFGKDYLLVSRGLCQARPFYTGTLGM